MTVIERAHIEQFRTLIAGRLGLHYEDGKLDYLADVIRQRMGKAGSAGSYVERLASSPGATDELRGLAEQLTVNETFFFRNADHFQALAAVALPARILAKSVEKRLRILSAGCASGEEAYSLAAMVREAIPDLKSWDVKIIGIDVNPAMIAKAAEARYSAWSLRATSEEARRRYFRPDGRDFVLDPDIRKMVTFEERNLIEEDPLFWRPLTYDLVFCRNVLMYFTPERIQQVVHRITRAMLPGGFLFLGHAETLRGLSQEFHLCHTHETFYYRLREASDAPVVTTLESAPWRDRGAAVLPAVLESTASWVDAIQQASERIATLTNGRPRPAGRDTANATPARAPHPVTTRTWDLGLVLEAMRQERFADALTIICSLPPDSYQDRDALLLRAVLLTNNGRLDESEDACRRLLALDEFNAGARYLMALCREHAADTAGAIEHEQTAIYLDPGFAMPHLHLGLMAKRSGDQATAERELEEALLLLGREDASRILLFGGGFSRETLMELCRAELRSVGGGHE